MPQETTVRPDHVKNAVTLLLSGDEKAWERGYYATLFNRSRERHSTDYPLFNYGYERRDVLYAWVNKHEIRNEPIDYFEFGVFKGESFNHWRRINNNRTSRFFGFDSFEGLPEDWEAAGVPSGGYSAEGNIPKVLDKRASFIPGWFNKTLRPFLADYEPTNRMVVHMDADLYSSTLYVLMNLDPFMAPGTVILFDEFKGVDEFPAFYHYCKACGREWCYVAARQDFVKVAVRIEA